MWQTCDPPFLDGYCNTVQGLLDWFEVDLGFTEPLFIQIDLCAMCADVRSYGPETIYMVGDLPEGTYAVMAYVLTNSPRGLFTGGCERISLWSG